LQLGQGSVLYYALENMTWYNREDEPEVRVDWFTSSEDDIREEVVRIPR